MKKLKLCMLAVTLLTLWAPTVLQAQLIRLSAQFRRWDGFEDSCTATPLAGGCLIYTKTVTVPPGKNVLFITYATTGDTHNDSSVNSMNHICLVDGVNCNPGSTSSASSVGWIVTQKPCDNGGCVTNPSGTKPGDRHDNSIMYEWCANITASSVATLHTVNIRLASTNGTDPVFNEGSHIFIDTTKSAGGCTTSTTP